MTTGKSPFTGDNPLVIMNAHLSGDPVAPRTLNPDISEQVEEIILKAMAHDPSERYGSTADFKRNLDHPEQVRVTSRAGAGGASHSNLDSMPSAGFSWAS